MAAAPGFYLLCKEALPEGIGKGFQPCPFEGTLAGGGPPSLRFGGKAHGQTGFPSKSEPAQRRVQRIRITSLCGGSPNSRLYSRLNCVGLS